MKVIKETDGGADKSKDKVQVCVIRECYINGTGRGGMVGVAPATGCGSRGVATQDASPELANRQ